MTSSRTVQIKRISYSHEDTITEDSLNTQKMLPVLHYFISSYTKSSTHQTHFILLNNQEIAYNFEVVNGTHNKCIFWQTFYRTLHSWGRLLSEGEQVNLHTTDTLLSWYTILSGFNKYAVNKSFIRKLNYKS